MEIVVSQCCGVYLATRVSTSLSLTHLSSAHLSTYNMHAVTAFQNPEAHPVPERGQVCGVVTHADSLGLQDHQGRPELLRWHGKTMEASSPRH